MARLKMLTVANIEEDGEFVGIWQSRNVAHTALKLRESSTSK